MARFSILTLTHIIRFSLPKIKRRFSFSGLLQTPCFAASGGGKEGCNSPGE